MGLKESEHIGRIVVDPEGLRRRLCCRAWVPCGARVATAGLYKTTDGG